jgi:hypothetical protein
VGGNKGGMVVRVGTGVGRIEDCNNIILINGAKS